MLQFSEKQDVLRQNVNKHDGTRLISLVSLGHKRVGSFLSKSRSLDFLQNLLCIPISEWI